MSTNIAEFAELAVKMHESFDLSDREAIDDFRGYGFRHIAGHYMSIQRIPQWTSIPVRTTELGPQGIVPGVNATAEMGIHVTYAGTPHHVPFGYGFWHINDADEIYIWTPGQSPEDLTTFVIVEREREPGERDMVAWYCQKCLNLLYCAVHESGNDPNPDAWPGTARASIDAVHTFNDDMKLRTCSECKTVHPLAYQLIDLNEPPLSDEEAKARFEW